MNCIKLKSVAIICAFTILIAGCATHEVNERIDKKLAYLEYLKEDRERKIKKIERLRDQKELLVNELDALRREANQTKRYIQNLQYRLNKSKISKQEILQLIRMMNDVLVYGESVYKLTPDTPEFQAQKITLRKNLDPVKDALGFLGRYIQGELTFWGLKKMFNEKLHPVLDFISAGITLYDLYKTSRPYFR